MTAANASSKSYKFHRPLESFQLLTAELHREHACLLDLEQQLLDCSIRVTELENYVCQAKKHWLEKKTREDEGNG